MSTSMFDILMAGICKHAQDEEVDKAVKETYKPGENKGVDDEIKNLPPEKRDDYLKRLREIGSEKTSAGRPMASEILNSIRPVMVVGFHPQNQSSMIFVRRLDSALTDASGLEKLRIVVLNPMLDATVVEKLGISIPSAAIFRSGKKIGELDASMSPSQMLKYLGENKAKLLS